MSRGLRSSERTTTTTREWAEWACHVYSTKSAPADVQSAALTQRLSVLGALAASESVLEVPPIGRLRDSMKLHAAIDRAAALDFDDYVCFGHPGVSSVLVPLFVSSSCRNEVTVAHDDVAAAQIVSNELHARLAGACLLGQHGPTQWGFAHSVSAAASTALLYGLDEVGVATAMNLALAQPIVTSEMAFFGPDTRSLTVANSALFGVECAKFARLGRSAPTDGLSADNGFLARVVRRPVMSALEIGTGWALQTLSVKTRPACSYVDPILDGLDDLEKKRESDISGIVIGASFPTVQMERLSARFRYDWQNSPSIVAFSARVAVATSIVNGAFTVEQVRPTRKIAGDLAKVEGRIRLEHSLGCSRQLVASLSRTFLERTALGSPRFVWDYSRLSEFEMRFPVRLRLSRYDGTSSAARVDVPRGAAGSNRMSPRAAAEEKFMAWAPKAWSWTSTALFNNLVANSATKVWGEIDRPA